ADHLGRGLDGEDVAIGRLVGAGARAHVQHRAGGAEGRSGGGGGAGIGAAVGAIADADPVVQMRRDAHRKRGRTSRAKSSMERRTLSSGRPPKFIQHMSWPTPISLICSMWRAT